MDGAVLHVYSLRFISLPSTTHLCRPTEAYDTDHRLEKVVIYRGADKSLPGPGRKQANVSVRLA